MTKRKLGSTGLPQPSGRRESEMGEPRPFPTLDEIKAVIWLTVMAAPEYGDPTATTADRERLCEAASREILRLVAEAMDNAHG